MTQTSGLTQDELETLAEIADLMIPESATHGVPGADDPAVLAEIAHAAQQNLEVTSADLTAFAETAATDGASRAEAFQHDHAGAASRLQTLIVTSYYRDDRVMKSLGMDARAPFPKGFEVEQGDWSLLDPVRAMKPIYRPIE